MIKSPVRSLLAEGSCVLELAREWNVPMLIHSSIAPNDVWSQCSDILDVAEAWPDVGFVLDHGGIPDIAANDSGEWMRCITALAERPNVSCKISGLLLYAAPSQRSAGGIRPWFEHLIDAFGWDRVVWGGDWPVFALAVPLTDWIAVTHELLITASTSERDRLLGANARTIYHL